MGSNDHSDTDGDAGLQDFISRLLASGQLGGAAAGIAKQAIDRGLDSLSDLQRDTLENHGLATWRERRMCSVEHCSEAMPWDEVDVDDDDEQVCGRCRHKFEQD